MNDIRIYDYQLNLLHIEPAFSSSYWTLCYNDIGTLECTFPLSSKILSVILNNKYLIITQGNLQAIITAYSVDSKITVYAKTVNWILSRKTFKAFSVSALMTKGDIADKKGKSVIEYIFTNTFGSIDFFNIVFLAPFEQETDFEKTERSTFSDILKELLSEQHLGHRVRLDISLKKWILEIYCGVERPAILSESNRNLADVKITDDIQNFYSSAWYNKDLVDKGDYNVNSSPLPNKSLGSYYRIVNEDETSSHKKYPNGSYLVCVDISRGWEVFSELPVLEEKVPGSLSGIYDWDTIVSAGTLSEAKTELAEKRHVHNLSANVIRLSFGQDYELGDIFKIQVIKGNHFEVAQKHIDKIELWWEKENIGENLSFKE